MIDGEKFVRISAGRATLTTFVYSHIALERRPAISSASHDPPNWSIVQAAKKINRLDQLKQGVDPSDLKLLEIVRRTKSLLFCEYSVVQAVPEHCNGSYTERAAL